MGGVLVDRATPAGTFVGRERELRLLTRLAHANRSGGAAALVHGEAGIGKTALLTAVAEERAGRTLWACGAEAESTLPFAAVADLLAPLHEHFAQLPPVQWAALEVSMALRDGPPVPPFAMCAATLGLLAAAAEQEPLLVVVDDLHWVDAASQQVLRFVARRLGAEPVVLLCAVCDQPPLPDPTFGLPAVHLTGLDPEQCRELVVRRDHDVAGPVLDLLVHRSGGNPLSLLESLAAMPDVSRSDADGEPGADLAPGRSLRHAWSRVLDALPEATRTALFVVTAGRPGAADGIEPVLAALGGALADLAPAERAGLVTVRDRVPALHHPHLSAVLAERTPLGVRVAVHRAWAEHGDGRNRTWHHAAAAIGPDEGVARELVAAAAAARDRGAHPTAAQLLVQAAELTPQPRTRAERLRDAAVDALVAGRAGPAYAHCTAALALRADPGFRADVAVVAARALTALGYPGRATDELVRVAEEAEKAAAAETAQPADRERAALLYAAAVLPAAAAHRIDLALDLAQRGDALAAPAAPTLAGTAASAAAHLLAGQTAQGRQRLTTAHRLLAAADPARDTEHLLVLARTALWVEDHERARAAIGALVDDARSRGAAGLLGQALTLRAELGWWSGEWAAAEADAAEAARWGEELGQIGATALAVAARARLDASRGDLAACHARMAEVTRRAGPYGLGIVAVARPAVLGLAFLGAGDLAQAVEELELAQAAATACGLAAPTAVPFLGDLAEAHVRIGDAARTVELLAWLDTAAKGGLAYPAAAAARCRGLLADDPDLARCHFGKALQLHRRLPAPFELARTRLCEGEALRRLRRPAAARPLLRAALAAFDALGARPWAARATAELAATGQYRVSRPPATAVLDTLTPQERQIARAVAEGLNNVEAAAALYLSRKTVEAHLTRVYRKLGLRSRTDLARVLAQLPDHLAGAEPVGFKNPAMACDQRFQAARV